MKLTLLQNMLNSQQIQELFDKLDTVTIKEKVKFIKELSDLSKRKLASETDLLSVKSQIGRASCRERV